jgi:hypothetical protein
MTGLEGKKIAAVHKIFQLSASLFDNTVLSAEDDTHATQVTNLCLAHHQGVDIEPSPS